MPVSKPAPGRTGIREIADYCLDMANARNQFPPGAIDWLIGPRTSHILTCTSSTATSRMLARMGHQVLALLQPESAEAHGALRATNKLTHIVGDESHLPIGDCVVDIVVTNLPERRLEEALSGFARVLAPGGWLAFNQLNRDDSVPWVRRMVELMRSYDQNSMRGSVDDSEELLSNSKYFSETVSKQFRVWVPVTHEALFQMIAGQAFLKHLSDAERRSVISQATDIYESAGQSLRLPYLMNCVRAQVDHAELTIPIQLAEDGLIIPL